ncbi:MAG: DUF2156 domain-containing protein [Elusimicrobia bacterium]|nr:DUF2156 domain-containing protein [Elusimicrobiota bacterium]
MFKVLKTDDYPFLKEFFEHQNYPLCEYSLSSITAWNHCIYNAHFIICENELFISEVPMESPVKKRLLLPLAKKPKNFTPAELFEKAKKFGYERYYYVPENYLKENDLPEIEKFFEALEQTGYMDYVYPASDMKNLKGHKFSKKRNLITQFKKQFPESSVKTELISKNNAGQCISLLEEWSKRHDEPEEGLAETLDCEKKAIINSLKNFDLLEMKGIMVEIEGKTAGFAIGSRLSSDAFALHFEKASGDIKGLYQFLDNEFAKILPDRFIYINKESDLDKPSLKKAKESYYPVKKIKSYILSARTI